MILVLLLRLQKREPLRPQFRLPYQHSQSLIHQPSAKSAKCNLFERWMLQDGTTNNLYHLFVRAEADVEVQTSRGQSVISIAVSFYDLDRLKPTDLSLVDLLVCSIDKHGGCSSAKRFVRDHVERSVSDVKPFPLHGLLIRAGEVGSQQIVTVIGTKQ